MTVFFVAALAITVYLMKKDPALLARRMRAGARAETEKNQKILLKLAEVVFVAIFVLSAIDTRFGWSVVPLYGVIGGDVLVATGFFIVFLVFKENTFASATIEVDTHQKIISTGPYALVRHPMYSGAIIMLLGVPLALGSLWGLALVVLMTALIVRRLRLEEDFLVEHLSGYQSYQQAVKYRLLPLCW
ncbi:isoprenylcysteine carboxylmethyltransferase family protein [Glaciimonas sp. PCH181]|uniref:methyltransferase family protein n=1 Tax=Glaciimonas sp. PCH181 TaxID=2133943 RepID=UPI00191C490C|nr:isoprenylcysteine carboxylmethyltransferase family protein [Glaciimonas sp. PCH181]